MQVKFPYPSPDKRHIMSWVNDTASAGANWRLSLLQLVIRDFSCSVWNEVELTKKVITLQCIKSRYCAYN